MGAYSQVYDQMPLRIYEAAVRYKVGTPLQGPRRKIRQILLSIMLLIIIMIIGILSYWIYNAINSNFFSQVSHDLNSISSADQFFRYLWQQTLRHRFWEIHFRLLAVMISGVKISQILYYAAHSELYFCTDGLLLIDKKQERALHWSEVKEFYSSNSQVTRLVKMDGDEVDISVAMLGCIGTPINSMILDELMKRLLPVARDCYERGEEVTFGKVKVSKRGISLPEQQISWHDLGAIKLEKNQLSAFYVTPPDQNKERLDKLAFRGSVGKWHIWQKQNVKALKAWPNLPVFMQLVDPIVARHASYVSTELSGTSSEISLRERAESAWIKAQKRGRMVPIYALGVPVCIILLLGGYFFYQSTVEQQQAESHAQLMRASIYQLAHQPYYVSVPGQNCDHGKAIWFNDNTKNDYDCQPGGLLMTQNDFQYEDGEYFSFMPDDDQTLYGQYIPMHYRVQVKVTFIAGGPASCVALGVHIQSSWGRQKFEVCEGGSWYYYNCAPNCPEYKQTAWGEFPPTKSTYMLAVDVTSTTLKLLIDNQVVATIQDKSYSATDQVELILDGDQNAGDLVKARFSDFLYTPYP